MVKFSIYLNGRVFVINGLLNVILNCKQNVFQYRGGRVFSTNSGVKGLNHISALGDKGLKSL